MTDREIIKLLFERETMRADGAADKIRQVL